MKKSVRKIMSLLLSTSILMGIGLCEAIPFTHTSIRADAATEKNGAGTFKPGSAGTFTIKTYAKDSTGKASVKEFTLTAK